MKKIMILCAICALFLFSYVNAQTDSAKTVDIAIGNSQISDFSVVVGDYFYSVHRTQVVSVDPERAGELVGNEHIRADVKAFHFSTKTPSWVKMKCQNSTDDLEKLILGRDKQAYFKMIDSRKYSSFGLSSINHSSECYLTLGPNNEINAISHQSERNIIGVAFADIMIFFFFGIFASVIVNKFKIYPVIVMLAHSVFIYYWFEIPGTISGGIFLCWLAYLLPMIISGILFLVYLEEDIDINHGHIKFWMCAISFLIAFIWWVPQELVMAMLACWLFSYLYDYRHNIINVVKKKYNKIDPELIGVMSKR